MDSKRRRFTREFKIETVRLLTGAAINPLQRWHKI